MHPNIDQSPIDQSVLAGNMAVFDIVYNPLKTKLLQEAQKAGCKILGGIGMLIYQGLESFKLWFPNSNPNPKIVFEVLNA
jgi:shikimate dehydrogenase